MKKILIFALFVLSIGLSDLTTNNNNETVMIILICDFVDKPIYLYELKKYGNITKFNHTKVESFGTRDFLKSKNHTKKLLQNKINIINKKHLSHKKLSEPIPFIIIGTDEFRLLKKKNYSEYIDVIDTLKSIIESIKKINFEFKFYLLDRVDDAWTIFDKNNTLETDTSLISINRFQTNSFFQIPPKNIHLNKFMSKHAKNEGFHNMFSMTFDCTGAEYMEIRTNNYVFNQALNKAINNKNKFTNPCYPDDFNYSHDNKYSNYEICDPDFYKKENGTILNFQGKYNETKCYEILDNILKGDFCIDETNCSNLNLWHILNETNIQKIQISYLFSDINITEKNIDNDNSLLLNIAKYCTTTMNYSNMIENKNEKCFYTTYLRYLIQKMNKYNYNISLNGHIISRIPYLLQLAAENKLYNEDNGVIDTNIDSTPNTTRSIPTDNNNKNVSTFNETYNKPKLDNKTTILNYTALSQKSSKNIGKTIGIIVAVLLFVALIVILIFFLWKKKLNRKSKLYNVQKASKYE